MLLSEALVFALAINAFDILFKRAMKLTTGPMEENKQQQPKEKISEGFTSSQE